MSAAQPRLFLEEFVEDKQPEQAMKKATKTVSRGKAEEVPPREEFTNQSQDAKWALGAIVAFIAANTFFLVHEQTVFFLLKDYHWSQAIFFSVLVESALLLLSYLACCQSTMVMKGVLYGILAATVCVSAGIVLKSVERKEGSVSARS